MMPHFRYLSYVLRHKWHVLYAGLKLGVPIGRLVSHDWTKFTPAEWGPYVRRFGAGNNSKWEKESDPEEWKDAWSHHWQRNPHHWEYWTRQHPDTVLWITASSEPDAPCLPMPETYTREMVADWYGAGMAQGKPDIAGWYGQYGGRMVLDPDTRARVAQLLGLARERGLIP